MKEGPTAENIELGYFDNKTSLGLIKTLKDWLPEILNMGFPTLKNIVETRAELEALGPRQLVRQTKWLEPAYKQIEKELLGILKAEWDAAINVGLTPDAIINKHGIRSKFPFEIPKFH